MALVLVIVGLGIFSDIFSGSEKVWTNDTQYSNLRV